MKRHSKYHIVWILEFLVILVISYTIYQNFRPKEVLVGYPLIPGYQGINEQGEYYGYNHEIIQAIAKHNRWKIRYITGTFPKLYEKVKNGEIDLLGGVTETLERRNEVAFAQYASGSDRSVILSRTIRAFIDTYDVLDSKKIGFLYGSRAYDELMQIAEKFSFSFQPLFYETYDELMSAMDSNIVDAISVSSQFAIPAELVIAEHQLKDHYFVTALNNADILHGVNDALLAIRRQQPDIFQKLRQFFYEERQTSSYQIIQQKQQFRLIAISIAILLLAASSIRYALTNPRQRALQQAVLRAIWAKEFQISFIPIADYETRDIKMYVLEYFLSSNIQGKLGKEELMELKGSWLILRLRIHEITQIFSQIQMLIKSRTYADKKFIINLHSSYHSFWSRMQLAILLRYFLFRYNIPKGMLLFSFSSTNNQDHKTKYAVSKICQRLGIAFVMNEFGMQFSSLSQIKTIQYEYFKIDRIYTHDFTTNNLSRQIIQLIMNIAASLDKQVIIDGIDDEETYENARSLKCHLMQGKIAGTPSSYQELLRQN